MNGIPSDAIVVVDGGFNVSFRISSSINRGDKKIKVQGTKGFNTYSLYTLINSSKAEEQFFISSIDVNNNILNIRMAKNDRLVPATEDY